MFDNNCKRPCKGAVLKGANYFIELNSLEDLKKLIKNVGDCIIRDDEIEIYDEYRE
jgi:hypothetical protein